VDISKQVLGEVGKRHHWTMEEKRSMLVCFIDYELGYFDLETQVR